MTDYSYDIETFANAFTLCASCPQGESRRRFEISPYKNDWKDLFNWFMGLKDNGDRMVGFNNLGFDYPILHELIESFGRESEAEPIYKKAFQLCQQIIDTPHNKRWSNRVPHWQVHVPQVDLYLIHHFDNVSRATSLKVLEFNMRSTNIGDLPYPPETILSREQVLELLDYNDHDVSETLRFYHHSQEQIAFRDTLSEKYGRDFTNFNDTKIGKEYFIMELEDKMGENACYVRENVQGRSVRKPRQTLRDKISLREIVFEYVQFQTPEFQAVFHWFRRQTIKETKGVFTELDEAGLGTLAKFCDMKKKKGNIATLNTISRGVKYVFGVGGLHASVESTTVRSDDEYILIDFDVTSYYPSLGIVNRLYPAHLGAHFCVIYADVKKQRVAFAKGTAENAMLKLGLNGVYGASNDKFSPFFDPKYMITITVNGQLLLCQLAEELMRVDSLSVIQANTDGVTIKVKRDKIEQIENIVKDWELLTGLELERNDYSAMYIRDVNNYIAVYDNGKVKRKGVYEYVLDWAKNFSQLVVPKAVEAFLIHGTPVEQFIKSHSDYHDFMLRTKIPKGTKLVLRRDHSEDELQQVNRYYITNKGGKLIKIMPPLPKKPDKWRESAINKTELVTIANTYHGEPLADINYDYYIEEANKMINPLMNGDF